MDIKDKMVNALFINMYSLAKNDGAVYLFNFNRKSSAHLAAVHVASMLRDVMGLDVYVNTSLFNYLWLKWKLKSVKGLKKSKKGNVDIEAELNHIEKVYDSNIFSKIYEEYYRNLDRN